MICNMCMNYPTIHFVNDAIFSSRAERYCATDKFQCKLVAFDRNKIKLFVFNFRSFYSIILSTISN